MLGPLEDALADADARPANRERPRDRASQRAAAAQAREHAARLLAHRGRARRRRRYEPTDLAGAHRGPGERASARRWSAPGLELVVDCAAAAPSRSTSTATCGRRSSSTCSPTRSSSRSRATIAVVAARGGEHAVARGARHAASASPPAELPRLFERFHRVEGARRARTKAPASAWRWCRSSCGCTAARSRVESELGRGTHVHRAHPARRARTSRAEQVARRRRAAGARSRVAHAVRRGGAALAARARRTGAADAADAAHGGDDRGRRTSGARASWSPTTTPTCATTSSRLLRARGWDVDAGGRRTGRARRRAGGAAGPRASAT